jgi:hypothetical protein
MGHWWIQINGNGVEIDPEPVEEEAGDATSPNGEPYLLLCYGRDGHQGGENFDADILP